MVSLTSERDLAQAGDHQQQNTTKMNKEIKVTALDHEGYTLHEHDGFETIKEAKAWVKDTLLDRGYWDRLAENKTFAEEVETIQLIVDGEIHSDWFPEFKAALA